MIDILVNNAGVAVAGPVLDMDEDLTDWFRCIDIDLNGAMRMCYLVGRHMRDTAREERSSTSPPIRRYHQQARHLCPYHAAKAALNHLTRDLAVEWGPYGINVNAIAPAIPSPR